MLNTSTETGRLLMNWGKERPFVLCVFHGESAIGLEMVGQVISVSNSEVSLRGSSYNMSIELERIDLQEINASAVPEQIRRYQKWVEGLKGEIAGVGELFLLKLNHRLPLSEVTTED